MRAARRYVIQGRVQGVGFRFFAFETASHEGIHGWVANRSDGSVEVVAEGERESLDRFERRLRHGPRGARVERMDIEDMDPGGAETGFAIR